MKLVNIILVQYAAIKKLGLSGKEKMGKSLA